MSINEKLGDYTSIYEEYLFHFYESIYSRKKEKATAYVCQFDRYASMNALCDHTFFFLFVFRFITNSAIVYTCYRICLIILTPSLL
jgi:hypothetical protein